MEDEHGGHVHSYTVGLTRVHGHAELVFSGGDVDTAHRVLDELAAAVCEGRRLVAGETLARREVGCECLVVQVANPERLVIAQVVYRLPDLPPRQPPTLLRGQSAQRRRVADLSKRFGCRDRDGSSRIRQASAEVRHGGARAEHAERQGCGGTSARQDTTAPDRS